MNPVLRDLFDHQYWADATLWSALGAHPPARNDKTIRDRLHHIHIVQRAFSWAVAGGGTPFNFSKPEDFATFEELRSYAQGSHDDMRRSVEGLSDARLAEGIRIAWFK